MLARAIHTGSFTLVKRWLTQELHDPYCGQSQNLFHLVYCPGNPTIWPNPELFLRAASSVN